MSFKVALEQWAEPISVEVGQTILDAAIAAGVDFPHDCRAGNCGACKSRLLSGEVELSPYSEFALTAHERELGLILCCRAVPWSECAISWIEDDDRIVHPQRRMTCEVAAIENCTHDIKRLRLKILSGGPFTFSPGQYARLTFADLPPRDFSMANAPDDDVLEFNIRHVEGGLASSFVFNHLRLGDKVGVEGPCGTAYLRESHKGSILAVAGGSGLAPIKSILSAAVRKGHAGPIHVYLGVRDERDIYDEALVGNLLNREGIDGSCHVVLSKPQLRTELPTQRRTGLVTDAIRRDFDTLEGFHVYMAGPPVMVEAAKNLVFERGVDPIHVHADPFYTNYELSGQEAEAS